MTFLELLGNVRFLVRQVRRQSGSGIRRVYLERAPERCVRVHVYTTDDRVATFLAGPLED